MRKGQNHILISTLFAIFIVLTIKDMRKIQDFTGKVIGKLTVIRKSPEKKYNQTTWECLCSCGNTTLVVTGSLNSGRIAGCLGCVDKTTHGMAKTPTYISWQGMKTRCMNTQSADYHNYGGRGIKVCKRWVNSFENFYADMGNRPKGMTLERVNVNGDYKKSNCKWATHHEQNNNKRNSHFIEYNGVRKTLTEWLVVTGLKESTLYNRLKRGMSVEDAFTKPIQVHDGFRTTS